MKTAASLLLVLLAGAACAHGPARFECAEGRFSVRSPAVLEPVSKDLDLGNGVRATFHGFVGERVDESGRVIYTAGYMDVPSDIGDLALGALRPARETRMSVTHSEAIQLGPYPGRAEDVLVDSGKVSFVIHQRRIFARGRLYQVTAMRLADKPLPAEARDFLESLAVTEPAR